jgi:hypothetical protein
MPEFILDHGSPDAAKQFRALDSFTQGYIEAMFFTDAEPGTVRPDPDDTSEYVDPCIWRPEVHSSLPGDVTFAELAPATLQRVVDDCARFQKEQAMFLRIARDLEPGEEIFRYAKEPLDDRRLGQLFWYARNGHGVAFTDDGSAIALEKLQEAAQASRPVDSYLGDDGLIYLA